MVGSRMRPSIPGFDLLTATITHSSPEALRISFCFVYFIFILCNPHVANFRRTNGERGRGSGIGCLIYAFLVVGERKEAGILPLERSHDLRSHGDFVPRWKSQTSGRQTEIYGKEKMKKRKETGFAGGPRFD